jgi:hypothetical protein
VAFLFFKDINSDISMTALSLTEPSSVEAVRGKVSMQTMGTSKFLPEVGGRKTDKKTLSAHAYT